MRFRINKTAKPKVGAERIKRGFLFFPKKIGDEIRWFEQAFWKEHYVSHYHGADGNTYSWASLSWAVGAEWFDYINEIKIPDDAE